MATPIQTLVTWVRDQLKEESPDYWSDAVLVAHINNGIKDLWRRMNELFKNYFVVIDITHVTLAANSSQLAGVPSDCYKVVAIEPRVVGSNNPNRGLIFKPKDYNDPAFVQARALDPRDPTNCVVYYTLMQQGAPVAAPIILTAPQLTSAVNLKLVYNQTLPVVDIDDDNPIPGESDMALEAWCLAHARAKERADNSPDPKWLDVYDEEKKDLIENLTPRQIQEPSIVVGMFEDDSYY
jgi:hypothetical protein